MYPTTDPPGLRAVGEIDYATHAVWWAALDAMPSTVGNVHLELSELSFIDARGTSMLVAVALQLSGGRRIVLHHPPRMLPRILELCWPPLPSIKVAAS